MSHPYHHGDLRQAVLSTAANVLAEQGPESLSLRELARRAGVSHAAPAHHFGDRRGLLTAVAAEGFALLAAALEPTVRAGDFAATAGAYVRSALERPGHYAVMFREDLLDPTDPALTAARTSADAQLREGFASVRSTALHVDPDDARRAAWALVHGVASLWLDGQLRAPGGPHDVEEAVRLARACAEQLFAG